MTTPEACAMPIEDSIHRIAEKLSTGEWRLILEHPNPAEGTSVSSPEVSRAIGARLSALLPEDAAGLVERLNGIADDIENDPQDIRYPAEEIRRISDRIATLIISPAARIEALEECLTNALAAGLPDVVAEVASRLLNGERKG